MKPVQIVSYHQAFKNSDRIRFLFEWDETKAKKNLRKHKISFEEAMTVFSDPLMTTFPDEYHSENEDRCISIGTSINNRILLIVHTEQTTTEKIVIRIISCRKATISEVRLYEEES